jgi:hypothetical protein
VRAGEARWWDEAKVIGNAVARRPGPHVRIVCNFGDPRAEKSVAGDNHNYGLWRRQIRARVIDFSIHARGLTGIFAQQAKEPSPQVTKFSDRDDNDADSS